MKNIDSNMECIAPELLTSLYFSYKLNNKDIIANVMHISLIIQTPPSTSPRLLHV